MVWRPRGGDGARQFLAMLPRIRQQALVALRGHTEATRSSRQKVVANAFSLLFPGSLVEANAIPGVPHAVGTICDRPKFVMDGGSAGGKTHRILWLRRQPVTRFQGRAVRSKRSAGRCLERTAGRRSPSRASPNGDSEAGSGRLVCARCRSEIAKSRRRCWGRRPPVVASRFGLTAGRVSQLRVWLREHWEPSTGDRQLAGCGT